MRKFILKFWLPLWKVLIFKERMIEWFVLKQSFVERVLKEKLFVEMKDPPLNNTG